MDYDRNDALLHWLFRQTQGDAWFRPNEEHISSGVALRVNDGTSVQLVRCLFFHQVLIGPGFPEFRVFPYENKSLEPFETAVAALNPVVAVKVRSAAVHAALAEVYVLLSCHCLAPRTHAPWWRLVVLSMIVLIFVTKPHGVIPDNRFYFHAVASIDNGGLSPHGLKFPLELLS